MYDDDGTLMAAAKQLVAKGHPASRMSTALSRVTALIPVIGVTRTRLAITSFMYA